ncbi:hypothetical protein DM02DRAFT_679070 [Periconia macrospinosa]|uniref:Uncharacterized protein n=1 Tax=Periconia macrospinosa TaxID=97972 RepID=A0A2V1ECQ7_9PLEO|nr:hypothetical protein DM02DRAFT_679070 [Periconia macrospinosa]
MPKVVNIHGHAVNIFLEGSNNYQSWYWQTAVPIGQRYGIMEYWTGASKAGDEPQISQYIEAASWTPPTGAGTRSSSPFAESSNEDMQEKEDSAVGPLEVLTGRNIDGKDPGMTPKIRLQLATLAYKRDSKRWRVKKEKEKLAMSILTQIVDLSISCNVFDKAGTNSDPRKVWDAIVDMYKPSDAEIIAKADLTLSTTSIADFTSAINYIATMSDAFRDYRQVNENYSYGLLATKVVTGLDHGYSFLKEVYPIEITCSYNQDSYEKLVRNILDFESDQDCECGAVPPAPR